MQPTHNADDKSNNECSEIAEWSGRNTVQDDSTSESYFRGFCKLPAVVVRPIDICSYLNDKNSNSPSTNGLKIKTNGYSVNWENLRKCKVLLQKSDLNKLRNDFSTNATDFQSMNLTEAMQNISEMSVSCKICKKVYSSEKKLQNHQTNKHMIIYKPQNSKPQKRVSFSDTVIVHEVKEYHRCRKCPKIFENYKSLKVHMKLRHKKRKCYICNYCSKKFVDRMFFKVHIKLHCHVCGYLSPTKKQLIKHRRHVCRVLKPHKCKTCGDTFLKFMDLKDHSYDHNPTVSYICDICKDQFDSKCALGHHLAYLHSKKRPKSLYSIRNIGTERLYLCNFCDETSVERDVIENHQQSLPDLTNRAMTGYKDYYFCDQCMKKFATETTMLQHKWTHFLKTSDNSQVRPKGILLNANMKNNVCKTKYNIHEELPSHFKPTVCVEKLNVDAAVLTESVVSVEVSNIDFQTGKVKKAIKDPKTRKILFSKHRCETCGKYFSSNYCLTRHVDTQHSDYENLRCKVCEETFVWPSLLKSHKCILLHREEMPFDDARPEIHFDNLHDIIPTIDDFNIADTDDYINNIDFEIPAPIVTLNVSESVPQPPQVNNFDNNKYMLQNLGYKVVTHEIPIEF